MTERIEIALEELDLQPFSVFEPDGALLVSGAGADQANPMTISWGMFGIMWNRPVVMVMVRPTRYTWDFINKFPDFTLNWLDKEHAEALRICGSTSGRHGDKFAMCGLHAEKALMVESPVVAESIMTLECRTIYREMIKPEQFLADGINQHYKNKDYHGLFFGEIVKATGIQRFHSALS